MVYVRRFYSGMQCSALTLRFQGNLIYLGLLTQRVPILPPFAPSHIGHNQRLVPFGEVFDVPRLSKAIHVPLVEWHEVKDVESTHDDSLGCWSVWETAHSSNGVRSPIYSWMMRPMHVGEFLDLCSRIACTIFNRPRYLVHTCAAVGSPGLWRTSDLLETRKTVEPRHSPTKPRNTPSVAEHRNSTTSGPTSTMLRYALLHDV